jgi:hypothetical protein
LGLNNLTKIDSTAFSEMKSLKFLSLKENNCIDKTFNNITEDVVKKLKEKCFLKEKPKIDQQLVNKTENANVTIDSKPAANKTAEQKPATKKMKQTKSN